MFDGVASVVIISILVVSMAPQLVLARTISDWEVSQFQPNIKLGGRANTIAVHPINNDIILVASESGGLFRSTDRGLRWSHVDTLQAFAIAVAFVPANPNIVIVTTADDFKVNNGGGIWRSTDGGITWTQIPSPPVPSGVSARFRASEISIALDTSNIYVATKYGISISADLGAHWTHTDVFPGGGDRTVASVLALSGNLVLAGGSSGVRRSENGGDTWNMPVAGPGSVRDIHAFGRSPFVQDQAYVVNDNLELYYTEDGGDKWTKISSAPPGNPKAGGIAFIKPIGIESSHSGLSDRSIDLYFGNRFEVAKLRCSSIIGTNRFDYSGKWVTLNIDHKDTRDLAFDSKASPLLLATDGGLHKSKDGGLNWQLVGGGSDGYNALQIPEVKGQWIQDIGRYDLYFGTQDNSFWSSGDDGRTWNEQGNEGAGIELMHRVSTSSDSIITFDDTGAEANFISGPLFSNVKNWLNPPNRMRGSLIEAPKIIAQSTHVQGVNATTFPKGFAAHIEGLNFSTTFSKGFVVTSNLGKKWDQYATLPDDYDCRDLPKLSQDGSLPLRPVLYQSIRTGYDIARDFEINHLARIVKDTSGLGATVTYPLMKGFGGLGINPTMFAWYQVLGVDPENSAHIIAPDVVNEKMMETWTWGDSWTEISQLTSHVTNKGQFLFRLGIFPHASAISFSTDNPNMVAVGTWQAGIFISKDRGATWSKVPYSDRVTRITSLEWRTSDDIIVSTYGRGLWHVQGTTILPRFFFKQYCKNCRVGLPTHLPPERPPKRFNLVHTLLVFKGRIEGIRASKGMLREVFVSPGSYVSFFSDFQTVPDIKVKETTEWMGFRGMPDRVSGWPESASNLAGVVLGSKGELVGTVFSDKILSMHMYKKMDNAKEPVGRTQSPTANMPYLHLETNTIGLGEPIELTGRGFTPGMTIVIILDSHSTKKVTVGEEGAFSITVAAPREPGLYSITVRDTETMKIIDGANVIVRNRDELKSEPDQRGDGVPRKK